MPASSPSKRLRHDRRRAAPRPIQRAFVRPRSLRYAPAKSDVEILVWVGLLHVTNYDQGSIGFVVAPAGFSFYEEFKKRAAEPIAQVERDTRT